MGFKSQATQGQNQNHDVKNYREGFNLCSARDGFFLKQYLYFHTLSPRMFCELLKIVTNICPVLEMAFQCKGATILLADIV